MEPESLLEVLFLVFTGAAVAGSLALGMRQSLLVSYILLGILLGPQGLGMVRDPAVIEQIGHVGIIFLLFLLGLNLHPQKLVRLLRQATLVTLASALGFALAGWILARLTGLEGADALVVGGIAMFSSTIVGLKLLPTYELHHQHMGEVIIAILLLQDLLAIGLLVVVAPEGGAVLAHLGLEAASGFQAGLARLLAVPAMLGVALAMERYVLVPLIRRFDTIPEYVFITALGWCLGMARLSHWLGAGYEMGAFLAGVALAANPVSRYIAESLKPLRDFFLVLFFFALGAGFAFAHAVEMWPPILVLSGGLLLLKPLLFRVLLRWSGEPAALAGEVGVRLGQLSEFALLIAALAEGSALISAHAGQLIQGATVVSFVLSSYWVMWRYPTPVSTNARLRRD